MKNIKLEKSFCKKQKDILMERVSSHVKIILFVAMILCPTCLVTGCQPAESEKTKAVNQVSDFLQAEAYEALYGMLAFSEEIDADVDFSDFAEEKLKGCEVKETDEGCDLIGKADTYHLKYSEGQNTFNADDFVMKYKVRYTSYLKDRHIYSFENEGSPLENGMTEYTGRAFKCDTIAIDFDMVLGGQEFGKGGKMTSDAMVTAKLNDQYKVIELEDVKDPINEEVIEGEWAYLDSDGTIVFDCYLVSEDFAEELAQMAETLYTRMWQCAFQDYDYDSFCSWNSNYLTEDPNMSDLYEDMLTIADLLEDNNYDEIVGTSSEWNYPTEFSYSDGQLVLHDAFHSEYYRDDVVCDTNDDVELDITFEPTNNGFRIARME